jgi:hypothetical protein
MHAYETAVASSAARKINSLHRLEVDALPTNSTLILIKVKKKAARWSMNEQCNGTEKTMENQP